MVQANENREQKLKRAREMQAKNLEVVKNMQIPIKRTKAQAQKANKNEQEYTVNARAYYKKQFWLMVKLLHRSGKEVTDARIKKQGIIFKKEKENRLAIICLQTAESVTGVKFNAKQFNVWYEKISDCVNDFKNQTQPAYVTLGKQKFSIIVENAFDSLYNQTPLPKNIVVTSKQQKDLTL